MDTPRHQSTADAPAQITLGLAFWYWLKLGLISFGGPAGQIAIMHQDLVERKRWISERRFMHALNYCMVLPGPEAQQLAIYIGWLMHRTWGGIVAGTLFVLPSLFILIALSWVYIAFGEMPLVAGLFYGIKPAVTAIVTQATYRIGSRALKNNLLWTVAAAVVGVILNLACFFAYHVLWPKGFAGSFDSISAVIALAATVALFRYKQNVILVIAACAVLGLIIKY